MARPTIYEKPMTAAERKRRSRDNLLSAVTADLDQAMRECNEWVRCMKNGRPGATDRDIQDGFAQVQLLIENALLMLEGRTQPRG